jgi:hypothetical protein
MNSLTKEELERRSRGFYAAYPTEPILKAIAKLPRSPMEGDSDTMRLHVSKMTPEERRENFMRHAQASSRKDP